MAWDIARTKARLRGLDTLQNPLEERARFREHALFPAVVHRIRKRGKIAGDARADPLRSVVVMESLVLQDDSVPALQLGPRVAAQRSEFHRHSQTFLLAGQ